MPVVVAGWVRRVALVIGVAEGVEEVNCNYPSRKRGDSRNVKQSRSFPGNEAIRVDLYNALAQWRDGPVNDGLRVVLYNAVERGGL